MAAGDLTTLAKVRAHLQTPTAQTAADGLINALIPQASRQIHRFTGREFAPIQGTDTSATRIFAYQGGGRLYTTPFDLREVTSITIDTDDGTGSLLVVDTDYVLHPLTPYDGVYQWIELRGCEPAKRNSSHAVKPWREVTIVGKWGFATVPSDVELAANALVGWLYRNMSATPGHDLDGVADRYGPSAWPTVVKQLLDPYRVHSFGHGA